MKAGEKLPVGELMYGMMLPSGNDATVAFAEHFGDRLADEKDKKAKLSSYDCFVSAMNRKAAELGMKSTHFNNTARLAERRASNDRARSGPPGIRRVSSCPSSEVVGTPQHGYTLDSVTGYKRNIEWKNTNQLLKTEGYDGIKTGTTGAAGSCIVSTAERDGRRLIIVGAGLDVDREPLRGHAESVSLGVEGSGEDRRRDENGQGGFESKLNDEQIIAYATSVADRRMPRLLRGCTCRTC